MIVKASFAFVLLFGATAGSTSRFHEVVSIENASQTFRNVWWQVFNATLGHFEKEFHWKECDSDSHCQTSQPLVLERFFCLTG